MYLVVTWWEGHDGTSCVRCHTAPIVIRLYLKAMLLLVSYIVHRHLVVVGYHTALIVTWWEGHAGTSCVQSHTAPNVI